MGNAYGNLWTVSFLYAADSQVVLTWASNLMGINLFTYIPNQITSQNPPEPGKKKKNQHTKTLW